MQTATSETESESLDLSICMHHYTLRAPCPKGQGIVTKEARWQNRRRYPPVPIHRVAAAHVRIALLSLDPALWQVTTAQLALAGGCPDGGGRASVVAAARHGSGGRC